MGELGPKYLYNRGKINVNNRSGEHNRIYENYYVVYEFGTCRIELRYYFQRQRDIAEIHK